MGRRLQQKRISFMETFTYDLTFLRATNREKDENRVSNKSYRTLNILILIVSKEVEVSIIQVFPTWGT